MNIKRNSSLSQLYQDEELGIICGCVPGTNNVICLCFPPRLVSCVHSVYVMSQINVLDITYHVVAIDIGAAMSPFRNIGCGEVICRLWAGIYNSLSHSGHIANKAIKCLINICLLR